MTNTIPTPTDEIRAIRHMLSSQFGHDVHRIAAETRRRQRESGRTYISLPKREPQILNPTSHAVRTSVDVQ